MVSRAQTSVTTIYVYPIGIHDDNLYKMQEQKRVLDYGNKKAWVDTQARCGAQHMRTFLHCVSAQNSTFFLFKGHQL